MSYLPKLGAICVFALSLVSCKTTTFPTTLRDVKLVQEEGRFTFYAGQQALLSYQFLNADGKPGMNDINRRSGYIHPIYTPTGELLTQIQPNDHYHHYGLWNPWTKIRYQQREYDLWNLYKGQGTVRFAGMTQLSNDSTLPTLGVTQQHIAFLADGSEHLLLNELQHLQIHILDAKRYQFDWQIELHNPNATSITLAQYRYGGFGWRAPQSWSADNTVLLTSNGDSRQFADAKPIDWYAIKHIQSDSHVMLMSSPHNPNHPVPLRVWPEDPKHADMVFSGFASTRKHPITLSAQQTKTFHYRFIISAQSMQASELKSYWQQFATPTTR